MHLYSFLRINYLVMDTKVIFLYLAMTVPELNPSKMQWGEK